MVMEQAEVIMLKNKCVVWPECVDVESFARVGLRSRFLRSTAEYWDFT